MLIKRNSATGIFPEALEILSSELSVSTYESEYQKRPPLGIYNLSLNSVWQGFKNVLDELEKVLDQALFRDPQQYGWETQLLKEFEALLSAIQRHFDDCNSVLKCFFPASLTKNRKQFENNLPVKSFSDAIEEYRRHVSSIVNHIKHHQGKLRAIFIFDDDLVIPGYYVEGVDSAGNIGPFEKVHKLHKGKATAFSFSRDLKLHFYYIYEVSHHLSQSLSEIISKIKTPNHPDINESQIADIAEKISRLPNLFFVDEQLMDVPSIRIDSIGVNTELQLSYPDNKTFLLSQNKRLKVWISWISDGVSRTYKLPYGDGL